MTDSDFSYRLTENILSHTPRLVPPLPENAIIIQPKDSNSSFKNYIDNHFKQDAPVLLDKLEKKAPESTFWAYLSNDLDGRPSASLNVPLNKDNTWYEYDSIFAGHTSTYSTAIHLFSPGAFLFLFGFLFPPLWWVGSFYPTRVHDDSRPRYNSDLKMLKRWRTLNRFISLGFSTLLVIAIIIVAVLYTKT